MLGFRLLKGRNIFGLFEAYEDKPKKNVNKQNDTRYVKYKKNCPFGSHTLMQNEIKDKSDN